MRACAGFTVMRFRPFRRAYSRATSSCAPTICRSACSIGGPASLTRRLGVKGCPSHVTVGSTGWTRSGLTSADAQLSATSVTSLNPTHRPLARDSA
jgi:hypothetical protein